MATNRIETLDPALIRPGIILLIMRITHTNMHVYCTRSKVWLNWP